VYFGPLVGALAAVTVDDLGRSAARSGLNKIIVRNSGQYVGSQGFTFTGGVLTIDHLPHTNVDYGDERTKAIQQVLEAGL
jgi:hypothetical protein